MKSSKPVHRVSKKINDKVIVKYQKILEFGRELISSLFFPLRCPICDEILSPEEIEDGIHLACKTKLYPVTGAVCMHCGRPLGHVKSKSENNIANAKFQPFNNSINNESINHHEPTTTYEYCFDCHRKGYVTTSHITQSKSIYLYKGAIKSSMYRLKYANKREYAHYYGRIAVENHGEWMKRNHIQAIIPVPTYEKKKKLRGYNQAEALADEISKYTGIPVEKDTIIRVKDTAPQKELNHKERKNNLENAFQKGKHIVQYKHVLVVDDIYTTGCTAEAVAAELRKQGVRHIYLLSVCIGGNE